MYHFSNYQLTECKKSVICKSLHFAFPPGKVEYDDFLLPFELLFRDIKNCDLSIPQSKAVNSKLLDTESSSFDSFNTNNVKKIFSKEEQNPVKNLRRQVHLVIQKSDKGNTIVITEKKAYIEKMKETISDTEKFEVIDIEQGKLLNFVCQVRKK